MSVEEVDTMKDSEAEYLILLLTDSNLPTGGFVASSGLESYYAHGLLRPGVEGLLQFIRLTLETYSNNSAAFLLGTHRLIASHVSNFDKSHDAELVAQRRQALLDDICQLDEHYHSMTLNHVAQRASKAQGIALLTLFTKSFSTTATSNTLHGPECSQIIRQLKADIRADASHGHLPICWAAFTACLGINAQRSLQVHLFLQVRAIISSAIRLNIVGPYLAHRLLAFNAREIIDETLKVVNDSVVGSNVAKKTAAVMVDEDEEGGWKWTWEENSCVTDDQQQNSTHTPRMTWPLGDLIQARHDQLHSRLFNS
ncbi:hypothetical protein CBS101457_003290 [Exobasidium rhododendri]|nr:hypothetical protein CBS101457_003290 [Exobasidium rhododendri]